MTTRLRGAEDEGKVVDLIPRRPPEPGWTLPDEIGAAFSEEVRSVEPRSSDYWRIFAAYLAACEEVER